MRHVDDMVACVDWQRAEDDGTLIACTRYCSTGAKAHSEEWRRMNETRELLWGVFDEVAFSLWVAFGRQDADLALRK